MKTTLEKLFLDAAIFGSLAVVVAAAPAIGAFTGLVAGTCKSVGIITTTYRVVAKRGK